MSPRRAFRERLSARIAIGIGGLVVVLVLAASMCAFALLRTYDALRSIAQNDAAERHATAIGVAAREQYMHDSHGALLRDARHLGHVERWTSMLGTHVKQLRPMVGPTVLARLDAVESESRTLSEIFTDEIFPAALRGDQEAIKAAHPRADAHVEAMIAAADAAALELSTRSQEAAKSATHTAERACLLAAAAIVLASIAATLLARGLVQSVSAPLATLNAAAERIGGGDFDADAPATGTIEFESLRAALRRMANGLRDRETRLVKAERLAAIGTLAAGVAHELNNPLGVMLGYLKRLRRAPSAEPLAEELRIVEEEAQQCERIVADLVAFSAEPRLARVETDVGALVTDVCSRLAATYPSSMIRVSAAEVPLSLDPVRIGQVVRNLVQNAVQASKETPIEVTVEATNDAAVIRVADHGVGIEPEHLAHVFEPFFSRRAGGTGLGLAVSHGIVRAHGGTIAVESVVDQGTTFTVRLPRSAGAKP